MEYLFGRVSITPVHLQAVNFEDSDGRMDGRKKYLTAKYGAHQMALIRKRLGVEMWLLDEMAKLCDPAHTVRFICHRCL